MTEQELYQRGLLDLAEQLHMYSTGACPDLSDDTAEVIVAYLNRRMKEWRQPSSPYDDAVFHLCDQALQAVGR